MSNHEMTGPMPRREAPAHVREASNEVLVKTCEQAARYLHMEADRKHWPRMREAGEAMEELTRRYEFDVNIPISELREEVERLQPGAEQWRRIQAVCEVSSLARDGLEMISTVLAHKMEPECRFTDRRHADGSSGAFCLTHGQFHDSTGGF